MSLTEDQVIAALDAGIHLVESLNNIVVFGVGLWTWLIVFFVADFCIGVIFWFLKGRRGGSEGGDD